MKESSKLSGYMKESSKLSGYDLILAVVPINTISNGINKHYY